MDSILNVASDSIDSITPSLKSLDSFPTGRAVYMRPFEEPLQIVADVVDRVQVKGAIGAKNCLFKCSLKFSDRNTVKTGY